ncbi:MAG: AI-2E family transporter, partial [Bacilli bacterium]|nr:AI-2E family transporter [Bacilli bacterium]
KLDYKLLNLAIISFIVFLIYQARHFWIGAFNLVNTIFIPFVFAFVVAYAIHPMVKSLTNRKIPKSLAITIVLALVLGLFIITMFLVVPLLVEQLTSLFNGIITFIIELSNKYDINFGPLQDSLSKSFNDIILNLGKYVSNGAVNLIGVSLSYISTFIISFSASIYFLIDLDKIRLYIKTYLKKKSTKTFYFVRELDHAMKNYLTGFLKIVFISLIEYTLAYLIIGHPNALLLGFLAAVASLIPYFGGMFTSIIATITASVISPDLLIRTIITFLILSALDSYVINPLVYGKSNKIHPIIVILSVFAGGILFGIVGIIISLPVAILIINTLDFYKDDIKQKIEEIKE